MLKDGAFRPDLFDRLNVFPIRLPPLRERTKVLVLLIQHYVQTAAEKYGKPIERVPARALSTGRPMHGRVTSGSFSTSSSGR